MLFLDCEFNGFGGALMSMGICSDKHNEEFYAVLPLPAKVHPWVKEHVVPYLISEPICDSAFNLKLFHYLKKHDTETIIADWPEDFSHLMNRLCAPNGFQYDLELDMRLVISGKLVPLMPHNAISDARALMYWYNNNNQKKDQP